MEQPGSSLNAGPNLGAKDAWRALFSILFCHNNVVPTEKPEDYFPKKENKTPPAEAAPQAITHELVEDDKTESASANLRIQVVNSVRKGEVQHIDLSIANLAAHGIYLEGVSLPEPSPGRDAADFRQPIATLKFRPELATFGSNADDTPARTSHYLSPDTPGPGVRRGTSFTLEITNADCLDDRGYAVVQITYTRLDTPGFLTTRFSVSLRK